MRIRLKIILLVVFSFTLFMGNTSFAETVEGKTIRLESYTGTVSVISGTGRNMSIINRMRVFDGYTVATGNDSIAYLSIDSKKTVKLDENTKISVVKKDKVNEIQVITGTILFSVTEALKEDESLEVVTPTIAIGIRGTTGLVRVKKEESFAQLYSGKLTVKNVRGKVELVNPGETVKESEINDKNLEISMLNKDGSDIPSFGLAEINSNEILKAEVKETEAFEIDKFSENEKINREKEEEEKKIERELIKENKDKADKEKEENKENKIFHEEKIDFSSSNRTIFEEIDFGENKKFSDYEGEVYIFTIDEEKGVGTFEEKIDFSGDLEVVNSKDGEVEMNIDDTNKDLGGPDYKGGYVILD